MPQASIPTPPTPPAPDGLTQIGKNTYTPTAVWKGFTAQRKELARQLDGLQDKRNSLSEQLQEPMVRGTDRSGLEARIADVDARIQAVDKQLAAVDQQIAQAASVPGAVVEEPPVYHNDGPPEEVFVIGGLFMVCCVLPISIAFARRIWRRGSAAVAAVPGEILERLSRLDQAVESIAVEVERVGEGQRFMTRLFTDANSRELGAGAAEPVRAAQREEAPLSARRVDGSR